MTRRPTTSHDDVRAARRRRRLPAAAHAAVRLPQRHRRPRDVPPRRAPTATSTCGCCSTPTRTRDAVISGVPRAPRSRPVTATSPCSPTPVTAARSRRRRRSPTSSRADGSRRSCSTTAAGASTASCAERSPTRSCRCSSPRSRPRGPHVVTVLDCCHSGGGTRDPLRPAAGVDAAPRPSRRPPTATSWSALAAARPSTEFLAGALDHWSAPRPPHVALAACRSDETAKEHRVGDVNRGCLLGRPARRRSTCSARARPTGRCWRRCARASSARRTTQRPELFPLDVGGARRRPVPRRRRAAGGAVVHRRPRARRLGGRRRASCTGCATRSATRRSCSRAATTTARPPAWCASPTSRSGGRRVEPVDWTPADRAYRAVGGRRCPCRRPRCSSTRPMRRRPTGR